MAQPRRGRLFTGMLARIHSAAVRGVESYPVQVEVNVGGGLPGFAVVGLPQGAVREGRDRVMAALQHVKQEVPPKKITVNLAPADIPKQGSAFDLPIALGLLVGLGTVEESRVAETAFVGELGLDGELRPVRGALSIAAGCVAAGVRRLVLPRANAREASVVPSVDVVGASSLDQLIEHLNDGPRILPLRTDAARLLDGEEGGARLDLSDVRGQEQAKRALEVAAAGGHNLLLFGPPGSGKTMLARRLPGILPRLSVPEALEVTKIHSVAGLLPPGGDVLRRRQFRSPHHTVSDAGLVGGGSPPRPGEVSLAHHGVLFLDELPEFRRHVLESLRQPLEDGWVTVVRARQSVRYPARFILVAAMNPCPCGYSGDGTDRCTCDVGQVVRYRARVSGPLLDRIDLHVEVPAVRFRDLAGDFRGEESGEVRARVERTREVQKERFGAGSGLYANGQMGPSEIRSFCRPSRPVARLLQRALDRLGLSARAYHRILKVARTLADLEGSDEVRKTHAAEAIQYRVLDRKR